MATAGADNDSLKASLICERVTRDDLQALRWTRTSCLHDISNVSKGIVNTRVLEVSIPNCRVWKEKKDRSKGISFVLSLSSETWTFEEGERKKEKANVYSINFEKQGKGNSIWKYFERAFLRFFSFSKKSKEIRSMKRSIEIKKRNRPPLRTRYLSVYKYNSEMDVTNISKVCRRRE